MFVGYRRDPNQKGRGAEGANPGIRMKLSGKRTVTRARPGKIQPFDFAQGLPRAQAEGVDTDGERP